MLSDNIFVQSKKDKADLENQLLRSQIAQHEERSALEVQLLRAKIAELQSREALFRALTSAIEREEGISNLISFAQQTFQNES